ncbi:Uncharacterised protein [uncultured archaeon]|nr:Uncharacterised protein [uncultured archaeon]
MHDLRTVDMHEKGRCFIRHCPGYQCLTCAWRAVEQYSLWRLYTQAFEQLGVFQGKFDHLSYFPDLFTQAAHVLVGDLISLLNRFLSFFELDTGFRMHDNGTLGAGINNCIFLVARPEKSDTHDIPFYDRQAPK